MMIIHHIIISIDILQLAKTLPFQMLVKMELCKTSITTEAEALWVGEETQSVPSSLCSSIHQ